MEISDGIHRLEAPLGDRYVALYLLVGTRSALLIDTGLDDAIDEVVLPYLDRIGIDPTRLRYVLTTHSDFDHLGGNEAAHARFPTALLVSHLLDRAMVEDIELLIDRRYGEFISAHGYDDVDDASKTFIREHSHTAPTDLTVVGGERLQLDTDWEVEIIHTPGHSWGSISVWDPRSRTMFVGDAVLGDGLVTSDGRPAFPPTYRYVNDYRSTILQLSARTILTLATSHYPLLRGSEVGEFLNLSMAYTNRVEDAILRTLGEHKDGVTAMDIIAERRSELGPWPSAVAEALMYAVVGHLEQLEDQRRVHGTRNSGHIRWTLTDE